MSERNWRKAVFTYEDDPVAGKLYYFAPEARHPGPYRKQIRVEAVLWRKRQKK